MIGPGSSHQVNGMVDPLVEHFEAIGDAAGAAGKIDDQCLAPNARDSARKRGSRKIGEHGDTQRLADARRFAFQHGPGGFGSDVADGKTGAAGGEDQVHFAAVGPGGERRDDLAGFIGNQRAGRDRSAPGVGPGGDRVAAGI